MENPSGRHYGEEESNQRKDDDQWHEWQPRRREGSRHLGIMSRLECGRTGSSCNSSCPARTPLLPRPRFAALVDRHGPIVHRVCLDVLRQFTRGGRRGPGSLPRPGEKGPVDSQARVARPMVARGCLTRRTACARGRRRGEGPPNGTKPKSCTNARTRNRGPNHDGLRRASRRDRSAS